jgi:hypothetical protein
MTLVGHTLTGLALGIASLPSSASKTRWALPLGIFVVLANIPDIPLPFWGHGRYDISHSIFVNLFLSTLALLAFGRFCGNRVGRPVGFGIIAWFSHLLLDTFYNHGLGVGIFWPFSTATLAFPIPWFSVVKPVWPPTTQVILAGLAEFVSYAPLVLISLSIRNGEIVRRRGRPAVLAGAFLAVTEWRRAIRHF